jgi:hypothetical protein
VSEQHKRPALHTIGAYSTHPSWQPQPLRLPDDPGIGVHVTNVCEEDVPHAMTTYCKLYPNVDFSRGAPKGTDLHTVVALRQMDVIGLYANRKRDNG